MKNLILSIPDDLLDRSRNYAKSQGTTLNEMVRSLLKKTVNSEQSDFIRKLESFQKDFSIKGPIHFDRDEIYER